MLEGLLPYATETEAKYIHAIIKHGSGRKAATALGCTKNAVNESIVRVKRRAAKQGYAPDFDMVRAVPEPFIVRGVSTYYNKDGKPAGQWVKSRLDDEKLQEIIRESIEAMKEDIPRLAPLPQPKHTEATLCNLYTLTDCHVGMLSWHKETGQDWDLKIAESTLMRCFEQMVIGSPRASVGFVSQLGDFLHSDGIMPVTPTSGHILDQDGRFSKIVQGAIRLLRRVIDLALLHHERVVVLIAEGNHDMASSVWLRCMFKALYENEPRITVIDSELPYYTYQHGKTMLAFHHGHLLKNDSLPLLFAAIQPQMWGNTVKRYCHVGHRHHIEEKEHSGMVVVQHPTLAARDSYAARNGWISERQATSITYHAEFGQVARNTVTPEMVT